MTVKELIKDLLERSPNAQVVIETPDRYAEIKLREPKIFSINDGKYLFIDCDSFEDFKEEKSDATTE